jgi:lipoprotein-anchoring transpeptidase ErfK/SrfK
MRPTWIVLGLVVGIGAVAYVRLREQAAGAVSGSVSDTGGRGAPLARTAGPANAPANGEPAMSVARASDPAADVPPESPASPPLVKTVGPDEPSGSPEETAAAELRAKLDGLRRAGDTAGADALEARLDGEFADTLESRRFALARGVALAKDARREDRPLDGRVKIADRARRDLSRGLMLPEMFDAAGQPMEARKQVVATIASLNAMVMTYRAGVAGVTTTYEVKPGDSPVRIVSRQKLPYGPNVLLFWSHGGNLDPSRLRAGEVLVLPTEALEARVDRARHLLGLYLGGVLVKEFQVGVGKASSPTPPGVYEVKDKYLNPDWHVPPELAQPGQPRVIPYGDPRNELGDAWIPISSTDHPTGYGIHGTTRPDTVGTDCSNGCVRLRNAEAIEMTNWLRTGKNEGAASRVIIR